MVPRIPATNVRDAWPLRGGRSRSLRLFGHHFRGLHALGALHDLEPDPLAFLQAAKPLRAYRREMHEHVSATAIGRDESETLGVVEPLHGTHCHFGRPLFATIVSRHGPAAWLSISRVFSTRKRHFVTPFAQSARSAHTMAGTCPVAAARCAWISSRLIGTYGSGPQPAAQFATTAMQA